MTYHVLAWLTVASEVGGAGWVLHRLIATGRRPWSWQQKLPVPKLLKMHDSGDTSDVIGLY